METAEHRTAAVPFAIRRDGSDGGGRGLIPANAVTGGTERRGGRPRPVQPATSARTASVNGVHASAAHGPKARSVSTTQATPAAGSIHRNVPDWPK